MRRCQVRVTGTVQGVGMRPFVHGLAAGLDLTGFVGNDVGGVFIEVQGPHVEEFLRRLITDAPPMAVIDEVRVTELDSVPEAGFRIVASDAGDAAATTSVPADSAVCADCLAEMRDPSDRRFGYPFIACTNCGPRYTMVTGLPYDRANTSMAAFPLCAECEAEYTDPTSRRYHAQPTACGVCGPQLSIPIDEVVTALDDGLIVALKGIGGYHLVCDATRPEVVRRLRERKRRGDKPFAVMVPGVEEASEIAEVREAGLLTSPARPIVLLPARRELPGVAPGTNVLGVMLPYTPVHHLLFDAAAPRVLVMTSGNLADEPICIDAEQAEQRLSGIADLFCHHDRRIHVACDDSVVAEGPVRRSRGYVPAPLRLPLRAAPMLAVGGEIKATAAVARGDQVWMTQHIGDVENLQTLEMLERSLEVLCALQRVEPDLIVSDRHPGYLSRRWAREYATSRGIQHVDVQHHHAHMASLLAEHSHPAQDDVLAVVFDGTGYGADASIWGGELLVGSYATVERVGHLAPVLLPGGDAAVKYPGRVALAHLAAADLPWDGSRPLSQLPAEQARLLRSMLASGSHCTPTTSVGRLFDAVAAILGVRQSVDYEAQAAIELEAIAEVAPAWPVEVRDGDEVIIDPSGWLRLALDADDPARAAYSFHAALADAVVEAARRVRQRVPFTAVGLSGGVFANRILSRLCRQGLTDAGFQVLVHRAVPCNDGGLALGQVAVTAARIDM